MQILKYNYTVIFVDFCKMLLNCIYIVNYYFQLNRQLFSKPYVSLDYQFDKLFIFYRRICFDVRIAIKYYIFEMLDVLVVTLDSNKTLNSKFRTSTSVYVLNREKVSTEFAI